MEDYSFKKHEITAKNISIIIDRNNRAVYPGNVKRIDLSDIEFKENSLTFIFLFLFLSDSLTMGMIQM